MPRTRWSECIADRTGESRDPAIYCMRLSGDARKDQIPENHGSIWPLLLKSNAIVANWRDAPVLLLPRQESVQLLFKRRSRRVLLHKRLRFEPQVFRQSLDIPLGHIRLGNPCGSNLRRRGNRSRPQSSPARYARNFSSGKLVPLQITAEALVLHLFLLAKHLDLNQVGKHAPLRSNCGARPLSSAEPALVSIPVHGEGTTAGFRV